MAMADHLVSKGILSCSFVYIAELPPSKRKQLSEHCDQDDAWKQMAKKMGFSDDDVASIKRRTDNAGSSPTDELLKIWGNQYNHKIVELFGVFLTLKMYACLPILQDYVPAKYKQLIPAVTPSKKHMNSNANDSHSVSQNSHTDSIMTSPEAKLQQIRNIMPEIDYQELTEATNNWDKTLVLGKGGFGTVFYGHWKHTDVAIKQMDFSKAGIRECAKLQLQQSLNELKYLHTFRHDNILPLYGYCLKGEKPCLVYQLMRGGSLEERLYFKKFPALNWQQRINICLGTARGIAYLHSLRSDKPLIHGDIKPANILLDHFLQPKLGDFGLAREGPSAINKYVQVSRVCGTKPYVPPEYLLLKQLSTHFDTYSYGVVLLETFTGMRPADRNGNPLTKTIQDLLVVYNFNLAELIDKTMQPLHPVAEEICKQSIDVALKCISESTKNRPEMGMVLQRICSFYNSNHFHIP